MEGSFVAALFSHPAALCQNPGHLFVGRPHIVELLSMKDPKFPNSRVLDTGIWSLLKRDH